MMLILHIVIALAGLGMATWAWQRPTSRSMQTSGGLLAATLATGTWLVFMNPAHLPSACISGLVYTGLVVAAMTAGHRKLALAGDRV